MARSVATEANNNLKMVERLDLQNRFCSLSMLNMVRINSTIHIGINVKHTRRSASAKFPTK
jgi:hypothetical protein